MTQMIPTILAGIQIFTLAIYEIGKKKLPLEISSLMKHTKKKFNNKIYYCGNFIPTHYSVLD